MAQTIICLLSSHVTVAPNSGDNVTHARTPIQLGEVDLRMSGVAV